MRPQVSHFQRRHGARNVERIKTAAIAGDLGCRTGVVHKPERKLAAAELPAPHVGAVAWRGVHLGDVTAASAADDTAAIRAGAANRMCLGGGVGGGGGGRGVAREREVTTDDPFRRGAKRVLIDSDELFVRIRLQSVPEQ